MATPEGTRPAFGPEAQRRREFKSARAARTKAAALEALDVGRGWEPHGPQQKVADPLDAGTELAVTRAAAANERGRPLRWQEQRDVRREVLARQAREQPAGQPQRRRPTIDEYLESLTERQREEIEQSAWLRSLDERHQAEVRRRLAVLEPVEAEAEYAFQMWKAEQSLEAIDHDGEWVSRAEWSDDDGWSSELSEAERRAADDIAAATAGPLFAGDPAELADDDFEEEV